MKRIKRMNANKSQLMMTVILAFTCLLILKLIRVNSCQFA
jgi:hypothetical protein